MHSPRQPKEKAHNDPWNIVPGQVSTLNYHLLIPSALVVLNPIGLSRIMRKPTICICENEDTDQLHTDCKADHTFVFATRIVQFLFFLNATFQASSHLLLLHRTVCMEPVRKPQCWFSHDATHPTLGTFSFAVICFIQVLLPR